jgi:hypothetical protein
MHIIINCVLLTRYRCKAAFVVISIVVWDALPLIEADNMYKLLVHKVMKNGNDFSIINDET